MHSERNLVKDILNTVRKLGITKVKIGPIELIENEEGIIVGWRIIVTADRPDLKIVKDDD